MKQDLCRFKRALTEVLDFAGARLVSAVGARQGATLIEVIIATGIVTIALVALVSGSVLVVRSQRYSTAQHQATAYAQESLEWARKMRDLVGWDAFFGDIQSDNPSAATYCLDTLPSTAATFAALSSTASCATPITNTDYTRTVRFTPFAGSPQSVTALTTVFWTDGSASHQVQATLVLTQQE